LIKFTWFIGLDWTIYSFLFNKPFAAIFFFFNYGDNYLYCILYALKSSNESSIYFPNWSKVVSSKILSKPLKESSSLYTSFGNGIYLYVPSYLAKVFLLNPRPLFFIAWKLHEIARLSIYSSSSLYWNLCEPFGLRSLVPAVVASS
jgi:hypothetical protein